MTDNIETINGKRYKIITTPSTSKKAPKDVIPKKVNNVKTPKKIVTESLLMDDSSESVESEEENPKPKKVPKQQPTSKRLTDDTYKNTKDPSLAYLSGTEIKEKLKLYVRIMSDDIVNLPLGCRIKYVEVVDSDTFKYKPGGVVIVNEAPKYIVLASNRKSWSVQLENTIIFREKFEMVREEYETTIKKLKKELKEAHNSIARFNAEKHKEKIAAKKKPSQTKKKKDTT